MNLPPGETGGCVGEGGVQRKKGVVCVCVCGWVGGCVSVVEMCPDSW